MEILNDLTKCNFFYYILGGNKSYLIFKYLQIAGQRPTGQPGKVALNRNNFCIGDAFIRKQKMIFNGRIIRYYNDQLIKQYNIINNYFRLKKYYPILLNDFMNYSQEGYLLVLKYLVNNGADIHKSVLAFIEAIKNNHLAIIKYLVNNGIDISGGDLPNHPLYIAADYDNLDIVKYLVNNGANISPNSNRLIIRAVTSANLDMLKFFVKNDINIRSKLFIAMVAAISKGNLDVVEYLHSISGYSPDQNDQALKLAARENQNNIVQYFIRAGANSNILTSEQRLQFNIN